MRMVDHDALTDAGRGMDVDAVDLGRSHLEEIGQIAAPFLPKPMRNAVRLHSLKPLEEQQGLQKTMAGGIPVIGRDDVGTGSKRKLWGRAVGLVTDLAQHLFAHFAIGQLQRNAVAQRPIKRGVVKH